MSLLMKDDETPNSGDVRLFCPLAVVAEANGLAHPIEELRWLGHDSD